MSDPDSFSLDFGEESGFLRETENLIEPNIIGVYLAGPLTNNEDATAAECRAVREAIKCALEEYDYLGVRFEVYDPAEVTSPESDHSPEEVYATDHRCTVCADVVVFHVNAPSIGVGIESQLSASATTPRIVVRKGSVPTSRMFRGMICSTVAEINYESPGDVYQQLSAQLIDICPKIIESIERRRPILTEIMSQHLGQQFLRQRIRRGISLTDLSRETDIPEWWLQRLERCPEFSSTLSTAQIFRISSVLNCRVKLHDNTYTAVDEADADKAPADSSDRLSEQEKESLDNLVEFVVSRSRAAEERVFAMWRHYIAESRQLVQEAAAMRSSNNELGVVTVAEWRRRYEQLFE